MEPCTNSQVTTYLNLLLKVFNKNVPTRTILLSVISMLNEPNISSAANVDASVLYRKWKEKKDDRYVKCIR